MRRSDWLLFPACLCLTILLLCVFEAVARLAFRVEGTLSPCLVQNDTNTGVRGVPNSTCWYKGPEDASLIEYKFDKFGYRSDIQRQLKTPGIYRIVVVGSSTVMGYHVPYAQTFEAELERSLQLRSRHHRIQVYNEGMYLGFARRVAANLDDIFSAKPDLIFWPVTPFDISVGSSMFGTHVKDWRESMLDFWKRKRFVLFFQHVMYSSNLQYTEHVYKSGMAFEYLRAHPNADWLLRVRQFDEYAKAVINAATLRHIPIVLTVIPDRPQAALISNGKWPANYNPYWLGVAVEKVTVDHGAQYMDILRAFSRVPHAEELYYPVDGHPTGSGDILVGKLMAAGMTTIRGALR